MSYEWRRVARHRGMPRVGPREQSGPAAAAGGRHSLPRRRISRGELLLVAAAIVLASSIPGQMAVQQSSVSEAPSPAPPATGGPLPEFGGSSGEAAESSRPSPTAAVDAVPGVPQPTPPADPQTTAPAPTDIPRRVIYPAAAIDMKVVPIDVEGHVLDPPEDENAHWLMDYGMAGPDAMDTAYLIAHSCGLGYPGCTPERFPFNNLSSRAAVGQTIRVQVDGGELTYRVANVVTYGKDAAPEEKHGTWDRVPGRLVLISCHTGDLLETNVVVFADLER